MQSWPDRKELVARLTRWMDESRAEVDALEEHAGALGALAGGDGGDDVVGELNAGNPFEMVAQVTALRHEIKLMTKAARAKEERDESLILSVRAAIDELRAAAAKESQAADQAARPLVESLIDLDASLRRLRDAIEKARHRFEHDCQLEIGTYAVRFDELFATQPWWRRLLCRPWYRAIKQFTLGETWKAQRAVFDGMLEGLALVSNRLQRAMDEQAIVRMRCQGRAVDPEAMTVLEVVCDTSLPAGSVSDEVRAGYYWKGKVLRFAEVKAVGRA